MIESFSFDGLEIHACIFEAAAGSRLVWRSATWNTENFRRWGHALGVLHANTLSATVLKNPRRISWFEDDVWLNAENYLLPQEQSAQREVSLLHDWLKDRPESKGDYGIIHGDLCAANFHVDGDRVTMFDFDDSCYHWFIYDLVCAVAPAAFRPADERHPLRNAILEGYVTAHRLPDDWEEQFSHFLRMRGLYLFILHQRNWHGDPAENPKRGLIDRLRISFDEPAIW